MARNDPPEVSCLGGNRSYMQVAKMQGERHAFVRLTNGQVKQVSPAGGRYYMPCIHPNGDDIVCQGRAIAFADRGIEAAAKIPE
jgi:hypothetical protein